MEVILTKDVDKVGKSGTVIKVKDGFARNFLMPNNLALPVTAENLKRLELVKQKKALEAEKIKNDSNELKIKLEKLSLTIPVLAQEDEKMYASVTAQDIASALKEEGIEVDKSCVILDGPVKALGIYEAAVNLHPEVTAKLKIWIVKK